MLKKKTSVSQKAVDVSASFKKKKNLKNSILRLAPMAHGHNLARVPKFKYKA
jgi:hypothetical protein